MGYGVCAVEHVTDSGLIVESRAAFPRDAPNANDPADVPPATVGPVTYEPGAESGVEVIGEVQPASSWHGPPPRSQPWDGWPASWDTPSWFGRVEELTDVAWNCLDLNASVFSIMQPYLVDASPSLPRSWLVNPDPDLYPSWVGFAKDLMWSYQLGEAFVLCTARYDSTSYPAMFHVVPPWLVNVEMDGGLRRYSIGGIEVTADILHIPYQIRTDEARGHGPLEVGRNRVIAAAAILRYATNLVGSGGVPPAWLKHPGSLTAKQARDLVFQWADARFEMMGLTGVLSGGLELEVPAFDPEKMAMVDLERYNESRIATLLGVPPFLVGLPSGGDSMTYSNVSMLFTHHWRGGLSPKSKALMAALSGWALPRGTGVEVNRDEYVMGDPKTRAETWQILVNIGVLTPEQVSGIERYTVTNPANIPEAAL